MHMESKWTIVLCSFFLDLLKAHPLGIRRAGPIYQVYHNRRTVKRTVKTCLR